MGELTKTDNAGKNSPGPVYEYDDEIKYDKVSITAIQFLSANLLSLYL